MPIISQVPGFVAYYALDTGDDTVASISVFTIKLEQMHLRARQQTGSSRTAESVQGAPEITACEVLIYQPK